MNKSNEYKSKIIEMSKYENGVTTDEVSIELFDASLQNLITRCVKELKDDGIIRETGAYRESSNGGLSKVLKYNTNDGLPAEWFKSHFDERFGFGVECRLVNLNEAKQIALHHSNTNNRKLNEKKVSVYKRMMQDGTFKNHSTLHFDKDGTLINGHHRINAQISAGVPQGYICVFGMDNSDVYDLDVGKNRTMKDTLTFKFNEMYGSKNVSSKDVKFVANCITHESINFNSKRTKITGADNPENSDAIRMFEEKTDVYFSSLMFYKNIMSEIDVLLLDKMRTFERTFQVAIYEMYINNTENATKYLKFMLCDLEIPNDFNTFNTIKKEIKKLLINFDNKKMNKKSQEEKLFTLLINGYRILNTLDIVGTTVSKHLKYKTIKPIYELDDDGRVIKAGRADTLWS